MSKASGSIDLKSLKVAGQTATNFLSADSSGIMIYDGSNGEQSQSPSNPDINTNNVFIDSNSLDIRKGIKVLATFSADGVNIGEESATSRAKFSAAGFEVEDDTLLTVVKIGKGETLSNHYVDEINSAKVFGNNRFLQRNHTYVLKSSPVGKINFSIPWVIYDSANVLTNSGVLNFQFDAGVAETQYDSYNCVSVYYNGEKNITCSIVGNNYRSYMRDNFLGMLFNNTERQVASIPINHVNYDDYSEIYVRCEGEFSSSTRTFATGGSITENLVPTSSGTKIMFLQYTVGNYVIKGYIENSQNSSYKIKFKSSSNLEWGNPNIDSTSSYVRIRPYKALQLNGPVVLNYYGTSEAPYYSFGQRAEGLYGAYSFAIGQELIAEHPRALVTGKFNDDDESYAFQIGNGEDDNNRANIFTVDWDGNVAIPNNSAYKSKNSSGDERGLCYISTDNNYVYGYDSYDNNEGGSYLYGNTTNIRSKGTISIGRAADNNTIYINGVTYPSTNIVMPNNVSLRGKTANGNNNYSLIYASDSNNIVIGNSSWNDCYIYRVYTSGSGTVSTVPNVRILDSGRLTRTTHANSSIKIKHDIKDIENKELDPHRLYGVEVKQFIYNDDVITDKNDCRYHKEIAGFIAEQLHECYPIAVDINEKGECEAWQAQYIIPPMLKLIQEQHEEIEQLKEEVVELKKRLIFI